MADVVESSARIRFSPAILRRLGEELNPSIDQGIIELAKNAYDADATECNVWLDRDGNPRTIVIDDDGSGMTADDILGGWLVLGGSTKNTHELTPRGRRPAGNKGLGRLAALRLGRVAHLRSRPGDGYEYSVVIDWQRFESVQTVDDVELEVERIPSAAPQGTTIELRQLRQPIGRVDARRLARALVLLADPFNDVKGSFRPHLHSDVFADLAAQVEQRYFDQAEYHLVASVRAGIASAQVEDWRGEALWTATHENLSRSNSPYEIPDSDVELWAFILNARSFQSRPIQLAAVREWLESFGGVHIYVNGLRVAPYGNPGNDWLDMNLARARSPEERPSTNTSIGRVRVTDAQDLLSQKTDRSGFIETPAFEELRRFATDSLNWMAHKRLEAAEHKRRAARVEVAARKTRSEKAVADSIEQVQDDESKAALQLAFGQYQRDRDREAETLKREVQLYRTLSTAGITAATFAHESTGNPLKVIGTSLTGIESRLKRNPQVDYDSDYAAALTRMRAATSALTVLSTATLDLIAADKRRPGKVYLNQAVRDVCSNFEAFLVGRAVQLDLKIEGGREPFTRGSAAALESIVTNLINNALSAFEQSSNEARLLEIVTTYDADTWHLAVSDNGPGIVGITLDEIWLPGHTQRAQGTGLGLTIVRDSVSDLGGRVAAIANGTLGGATFTIDIPTIGEDDGGLF
ncbi:sensor histidine kinase [Microbacterium sp. YMB-B2]|uniref:histidine kinase n=1 Tax=Microbacterium tenebrionis TaxID=2830665 RepID=A0A9X1LMU2_9MICO|nr:sensor histidine kinase [Microbacterium tenebrionis]MCC2028822.1 sensor histidine kinase [Microbacterium tenebrionis]